MSHVLTPPKSALKPRPWLLFSSSTGQTFKNFYQRLDRESQDSLVGFFTDRPCAAATLARQVLHETPVYQLDRKSFETFMLDWIEKKRSERREFEDAVVFLCGFFGILSKEFLDACPFPVLNTHPTLLPSFPGLDHKVQRKAWETVSVSGFTVHMVDETLDGGPIVFQQPVSMDPSWTEDEARNAVRETEQRWLPYVWSYILRSSLQKSDVKLTSRELRLKHNFHFKSFMEAR
jgi:phosphoribosylglycinamide formyltransferase-1